MLLEAFSVNKMRPFSMELAEQCFDTVFGIFQLIPAAVSHWMLLEAISQDIAIGVFTFRRFVSLRTWCCARCCEPVPAVREPWWSTGTFLREIASRFWWHSGVPRAYFRFRMRCGAVSGICKWFHMCCVQFRDGHNRGHNGLQEKPNLFVTCQSHSTPSLTLTMFQQNPRKTSRKTKAKWVSLLISGSGDDAMIHATWQFWNSFCC